MLFAVVAAGYFVATNNVLLGRWTAPADSDLPFETNKPGAVKGIEFFRTRRFVTFGMKMNDHPADSYGTYHFVGSNRVSLETKGFRVTLTNRVFDLPLKGSPLGPLIMKPKLWKISDDGQVLEEVEYFGDGSPETFYKEPKR